MLFTLTNEVFSKTFHLAKTGFINLLVAFLHVFLSLLLILLTPISIVIKKVGFLWVLSLYIAPEIGAS